MSRRWFASGRENATPTRSDLRSFAARRDALLADRALTGRAFCTVYTELIDDWLADGFDRHLGDRPGVALVAVGGHGRRELTPGSDIDVMLLHGGELDPDEAATVWYPIWDAGLKLGHSLRTPKEALTLARDDLSVATALLSCRLVAGDAVTAGRVAEAASAQWRRRGRRWLSRLADAVAERHAVAGEVAWALEPDLKEGRGGLRDVHALSWAARAEALDSPAPSTEALDAAHDVLLEVRVALHRVTGRSIDRLVLQDQDAVAAEWGRGDADALMAAVAAAARRIAWHSDEYWYDVGRTRRADVFTPIDDTMVERHGRVALVDRGAITPLRVLEVAEAAASRGLRIEAPTLERLGRVQVEGSRDEELRRRFVSFLRCGAPMIDVAEALDHVGAWEPYLPEWAAVRSRPQRNAYHRFTVDRHLLEATAQAAARVGRVARPDLLLMAALLHDIGKGYPGDHTEVGCDKARVIATRMGFPPEDVDTLVLLIRHHLLLADTATRRDLDDPATVATVADAVGDRTTLQVLHALTEADSVATGPSAWGAWKAQLVTTLVQRADAVLAGEAPDAVVDDTRPGHWDELIAAAWDTGEPQFSAEGERLTLACADRPGLFSRVAGTLAAAGLDVTDAVVASESGIAVEEFRVSSRLGLAPEWERVVDDLRQALAGRLAVAVRLAERARTYPGPPPLPGSMRPDVRIFADASEDATVIEVIGPDRVGLLYRLTQALAELDLDIARARVVTVGVDVIDTFYVRDASGGKINDAAHVAEIRTALRYALDAS